MSDSCLAFDLGASSGRGIIGKIENGKLTLTEIHRFPNRPEEKNGHWFWDFDKLFSEIKTGIKKAFEHDKTISSIGIDTWGVDYVLFRGGKAVRQPYCYRDSRTDRAMEEFHKLMSPEELYSECGIQKMCFNTVYQLFAQKLDHPEDLKGSTMLLMPDALTFMLNGDVSSEYTIASTGALLDPGKKDWNRKIIGAAGLDMSLFPKIVQPGTFSAKLKPEICAELGVPAVPVVKIGSHDTASAVMAVPADSSTKWAYVSCGTWALLGAELDKPMTSAEAGKASFTNEGGCAGKIRFLTNIMGSWLLQETRRVWNEAGKNLSFSDISDMARTAVPGKFIIDPNANEFLAPGDMPSRIKEYCVKNGLGTIRTDAELVRCIYDSLADCFAKKIKLMESLLKVEYNCLNMVGGGSRDELLMELTAKATGIKVVAGPTEGTAIGNIMMQFITHGKFKDINAARAVIRDSFDVKVYNP